MKFRKWSQGTLAAVASAGLGMGLISCGASNTVDYVYLLSSKNNPGQINVYDADSESGALTQIQDSPYPSGGMNPVGIVIAPNGKTLYVINHDDNTIVSMGIGTDAKLYPQHTYNTPGSEPVAIAINPAGTFLFVVDTYEPGFTTLNPGAGAIIVYPINADASLGSPAAQTIASQSVNDYPIGNAPAAITVLANSSSNPANNAAGSGDYIYVTELLAAPSGSCSTGQGAIVGLFVDPTTGALTPVNNSPFCDGVAPSAIASNPSATSVYTTDSSLNQLNTWAVNNDGSLTANTAATTATGVFPDSITIDQTGRYLYVANRFSSNVQGYSITSGTGVPASTGTYATGAFPQCVIIEPNLNNFLYTADFAGPGSTGYQIDPSTGQLAGTVNSPYGGAGQSTCVAATPHNKKAA